MKINEIVFVYDTNLDRCYIQNGNQPLKQLTIKGPCERNGEINGTWFQVDHLINHWISFRKDRFRLDKYEVFYKCVKDEQIAYYRRLFFGRKGMLTFSFTERDEWIKDQDGKWKSKF